MTAPTPLRDEAFDVARGVAIAGVVLGHWLVTGLVLGTDGVLRQASPLAVLPALAPVTWLLQTLGLFFFVGGYAATRSFERHSGDRRRWLLRQLGRLPAPVGALLAVWAGALVVAACLGVPAGTLRTVGMLVVSPLWFLAPYTLMVVLTPVLRRVTGPGLAVVVAAAVALVAVGDARLVPGDAHLASGVVAGWLVPWVLGTAVARELFGGRRTGAFLLAGGVLAVVALIVVGGYPASAVGVPGDGRSNLAPPSLAAVALAVAQIGAFLVLRPVLRVPSRSLTRFTVLSRAAFPVFLTHQSVLLVTAIAVARVWPVAPGLLTTPDGPLWVMQRAGWLPVLALGLAAVVWGRGVRPRRRRGTIPFVRLSGRPMEVIAVRDSDPPSRGRAARQLS